jgi:hypothetical protein
MIIYPGLDLMKLEPSKADFDRALETWLASTVRNILTQSAAVPGADRDVFVRAMLRATVQFAAEERPRQEIAAALRALAEEFER